jgi:uncharacterized protein YdhG (YjbR/CyaY superfamily)
MAANDKEAKKRAEGEAAVTATIGAMTGTDRAIGERLHEIITANAPGLVPRTWYGMPAYANENGTAVIYFRPAQRFNDRYLTFGFNNLANLDDGDMWPMAFYLKELTPDVEAKVSGLVKKAVS